MDITIYKLTNVLNGMGYVGATKNFKRRMGEHRRGKTYLVDKAIHKYGWENFTAEVIEVCDAEVAPERERYWIKVLATKRPHGYNCTIGGEKGQKFTDESKMRLSAKQIEKEKQIFPVLEAELDKQQITRRLFAQKLGCNPKTVSDWMKGRSEPKISSAIKVKEVLGVDMPLEELFAKATN